MIKNEPTNRMDGTKTQDKTNRYNLPHPVLYDINNLRSGYRGSGRYYRTSKIKSRDTVNGPTVIVFFTV